MRVEWLILADAAQVNGGKLYLLGGGWDQLNVASFPVQQRMGLAASFLVPWNETNLRREVELTMVTEDGEEMLKINGQVEVGRPAGIPAGSEQRAQMAAEMGVEFKKRGVYSIIAKIDGEEAARIAFRVLERPKA